MALTLGLILADAGIDSSDAIVLRHAFMAERGGIHADSSDEEILAYTAEQSVASQHFPAKPPSRWLVFIREGGAEARLWAVVENRGEVRRDDARRWFDLVQTDDLAELRNRLVIGWPSPRAWWVHGATAAGYPITTIADATPLPFPGFDKLNLNYPQLQAVVREPRYAAWVAALPAVKGVYLITDTRDGRHYVGKADGSENIYQRWFAYATNGHGGNVELKNLDPSTFRYSLPRVFDPSTPTAEINAAERHYKITLASRCPHGLNRN